MRNYLFILISICSYQFIEGQVTFEAGLAYEYARLHGFDNPSHLGRITNDRFPNEFKLNYQLAVGYQLNRQHSIKMEFNYVHRIADWDDPGVVGYDQVIFHHTQLRLTHQSLFKNNLTLTYGVTYSKYDLAEFYLTRLDFSDQVECLSVSNGLGGIGRIGFQWSPIHVFVDYLRDFRIGGSYVPMIRASGIFRFGMTYLLLINPH